MSFRRTGLATLLLLVTIQLLREHSNVFLPLGGSVTQTKFGGGENDNTIVSIRPGDLPGYTGWGRSESTLAPFFRIVSPPSAGTSGSDITFRLECTESSVCSSAAPAFYVRAYGPSIITGIVDRIPRTKNEFDVTLKPIVDPGSYLVEVVLTFSNLPDFRLFPLPDDNAYHQFLYEGYHVLGSPFQIIVSGSAAPQPSELPLCRSDQLVETFRGSLGDRARWRVVDVVNNDKHQQNSFRTTNVTLEGYQKSLNSLGLLLDYQFRDCRLMPVPTPQTNIFQCVRKPIHIILIGDSTFRLQQKLLNSYVAFNPKIKVSFVELYGGYFKTQLLTGPNVHEFLTQASSVSEQRIILFNTGLHDIHRLCGGKEMNEDRRTYLRSDMPGACVDLYKIAISSLIEEIMKLPDDDLKIFQTTTAAWPKYGNYGAAWDPRYGQTLPLDAAFVEYFNSVALDILEDFPSIAIVDGYHVSYGRPDNREIDVKSALGRKLSHPGLEVISAMVRIWSMLVLQQVCG